MKIKKSEVTGKYSVQYMTSSGNHVTKGLGTKDKKEAERLVRDAKIEELERLAKIGGLQKDAIASIVAGKKLKLSTILEEWELYKTNLAQAENTIYIQKLIITQFFEAHKLIDKGITSVTPELVKKFLNDKDGVSLSQREQRQSSLKSLFRFAIAAGYTQKNPVALVAIDKSKLSHSQKEERAKIAITKAEYNKLIKHAPYFFKQAIALCWWTGLRIVDVCNLEWDCLDATSNPKTLTIHTQKRDVRICLPIDDPLIGGGVLVDIMQQIDFNDTNYCFPEQREWMNNPKGRSKLSLYFSRILRRLDMYEKGKGWHSLRRSFVTRLKREGKTLEDIAIWVGHSDSKTTEKYDLSST